MNVFVKLKYSSLPPRPLLVVGKRYNVYYDNTTFTALIDLKHTDG